MMKMSRTAAFCGILALGAAQAPGLAAQETAATYPSQSIRIVAPFAPGALTDILARLISSKMSPEWGQPVIVENRPGASGAVGTGEVAQAKPDGYTMVVITSGHVINPNFNTLPYDPVTSFEPVIMLTGIPNLLVVHPSVPANTLDELVELVRNDPASYPYATSGAGGSSHITTEYFKHVAGLANEHVPYKGGALAMADLAAGHVKVAMTTVPTGVPFIQEGRARPLAVSSGERSPVLQDVPTLVESGYPDVDTVEWWGVLTPAGTPLDIREKLNAEITRIMQLPDVQERLAQLGVSFNGGSIDEFRDFLQDETGKWAHIIKTAGVTID